MNLLEFLENWDDNTQVLVEKKYKKKSIFWKKFADMSEECSMQILDSKSWCKIL